MFSMQTAHAILRISLTYKTGTCLLVSDIFNECDLLITCYTHDVKKLVISCRLTFRASKLVNQENVPIPSYGFGIVRHYIAI